jgi:PAS domain S-box-containing protein
MSLDSLHPQFSLSPTVVYYLRRLLSRNLDRLQPFVLSSQPIYADALSDLNTVLAKQYPESYPLMTQKLERLALYHQALANQGAQYRQEMEQTEIEIFRIIGYEKQGQGDQNKGKVLIVDDRPENIRLLSIALKRQGYKTEVAYSGVSALEGVKTIQPDLILLDIMMPIMDGYEVCQKLKEDSETADIPIIFISALSNVIDKLKAFRVGGADFIARPFEYEEVLARVEYQTSIQNMKQRLEEQNTRSLTEIRSHQTNQLFLSLLQQRLEKVADYVLLTDAKGQIVYASESAAEILGYTTQTLRATTLDQIDPSLGANQWSQLWQKLETEDPSVSGRSSHTTKSGTSIPVTAQISLIQADEQAYGCMVFKQVKPES